MTQEQGPMIALIAHDQKKPDMLAWARRHHRSLAGRPLVATGTTGSLLTCWSSSSTRCRRTPMTWMSRR
ncbi:MAG: hypothetical protein FD152_3111 [Xanthobacteraceae bacterium]|nr:MAG: hypothetical protein FD152_3111 [Xanthobacteraceae bacterium]